MVSKDGSLARAENQVTSLIEIGKQVVAKGLVVGSGGNLSMLLDDRKHFIITATGAALDRLNEDSFAVMDLAANLVSNSAIPSSEYRVHLASYLSRSDINTCIHLHPQASIFASSIDLDIKLITTDHLYYLRKIKRIPWLPPGYQEIADATASALIDCNVIILENHGCVVVASDPWLAYTRALNLEEAAELTIRSKLLGVEPKLVPTAYAQYLQGKGL